jgi:cobalamin biosynthesis Mg chelatase CobN
MVLVIPAVCRAQLSSTNYQVEVFGVGEEGGGTATSSQYRVNGVIGTTLERTPVSPSDDVSNDGNNTSGRRTSDSADSQSVPDAISPMVTSPEQVATGPYDDQVRASSPDMSGREASYGDNDGTTEVLSLPEEADGRSSAVESDEMTVVSEDGWSFSYWWVVLIMVAVFGVGYRYKKRK